MRLHKEQINEHEIIVRMICNWCNGGELAYVGPSKSNSPVGTPIQHYRCATCGRTEVSYDILPKRIYR